MVATSEITVIPLGSSLIKYIQVGDKVEIRVAIKDTHPTQTMLKVFRVLTVDRINELISCQEVGN